MNTLKNRILATAAAALALGNASFAISFQELAGGYDILTTEDVTLNGAHIHGSLAAGKDLVLTGNLSEINMDANYTSDFAVVVKNALVQNGDAKVLPNGGTGQIRLDGGLQAGQSVVVAANNIKVEHNGRSLILDNTNQTEAEMLSGSGFSVSDAADALANAATYFAGLPPTLNWGSVLVGSKLSFTSATGPVDVINIAGNQLALFNEIDFGGYLSGLSKLIINVDLSTYAGGVFAKNFLGDTNTPADNVLWNFYGASSLSLQNQFVGTVLAPDLDVTHQYNDFKGSVFAKSFTKLEGQVHVHRFEFDVPDEPGVSVSDSGSTALLALLALPFLLLARRRR